jgi:four helix bundle protein
VYSLRQALVIDIYKSSSELPRDERYGLRSQIRRGAISTAGNIVEGCARETTRDYRHFLNIAAGSTCEMHYLLTVARRLGFATAPTVSQLEQRADVLAKSLFRLVASLDGLPDVAAQPT